MIRGLLSGLRPSGEGEAAILASARTSRPDGAIGLARMSLAEALGSDWVEFWYQPKINLQQKRAVGAEIFARIRHPVHGLVAPGAFLAGADEKSLTALNKRALISALRVGEVFARLGVSLRVAINVTLNALVDLPIREIVREHRPSAKNWPGLIFDVTEDQLIADRPLLHEILHEIDSCNIKLAIDDYGGGQLSLARLKQLPFVELKLDRAFVADCGSNSDDAAICRSIIDLAHNFGSVAVAMGVEKASEVLALQRMGCDVGQGFLFGQPMPLKQFAELLKQRTAGYTGSVGGEYPRNSG
jgi:EAL domain-containing protein (putative c-di-GMP-specific phosphodiesterase class I)